MDNPFSLEGKRILVTGASSGIGRACAELVVDMGAKVVLAARRIEMLESVRQHLPRPDEHICIKCDVSDEASITEMMKIAVAGGKLDGLVHSAGVGPATPLVVYDKQEALRILEVNYLSFLALMKLCAKRKNVNAGFSAVAVSSISAMVGSPGQCVYAGSKGALSSSVRTLAVELADKGIRVNAVCPSNIRTAMYDEVAGEINEGKGMEKILMLQALGIGKPQQVAGAVCFLLSEAASFITGVNLPVDGGYLAQ